MLTQKFIDGMQKYVEYWDGPVIALMESRSSPTSNLDEVENDPRAIAIQTRSKRSNADPDLGRKLAGCRLVLGSTCFQMNHLSVLCQSIGVPCVYVSEYSLRDVCFQQLHVQVRNLVVRLRRQWWEMGQEPRQRQAVVQAAGVQCNGTPTFDAYRQINPNPLLFFDTRIVEDMLINETILAARTTTMLQGRPLRLLFSGRFIPMKGVDHLPAVAACLVRLGVPFEMTMFGGGDLEPRLRADICRLKSATA